MSNKEAHFVSMKKPVRPIYVDGIAGNLQIRGIGKLKWNLTVDSGLHHDFYIDNAFYVPNIPLCILSPQHWAQGNHLRTPQNKRYEKTNDENTELHWSRFVLTAMHHPTMHVPIINS